MTLGVRGANPIWVEFDLQGKLFDDTFYMYVLENTIPYLPVTVYSDPDLNTPIGYQIQFLSNGTLPVDIFFDPSITYRLEFRKNNGIDPPSQNDPLIYEVNNYVPGSGGNTPIDTVALSTSNQITNPQFAFFGLPSDFSLINVTNPDPIEIGPGWSLRLTGTGNVSISQIALNSSDSNPSNAPYALRLNLTGWDQNGVILVQRFQQNGMLWANKIVSSTLTARLNHERDSVFATLVSSHLNSTLAEVLNIPFVGNSWDQFTGYGQLGATSNPDFPPDAYIEYRLFLPGSVDIYLSSIQLIVQDLPIEPSFEQDSIERQRDHTYHYDYPIVPVGGIIDYYGFGNPSNYLECLNQLLSRVNYSQLFDKLTNLETVTLTIGLLNFTVANGAIYAVGTPLEGNGIQAGTVIASITGNSVVMSLAATAAGPQSVRFFCTGNGDGSTTFNAPNLSGVVLAGAGGSLFPASMGVGTRGGEAAHTLTIPEMPNHHHPGSFTPLGNSTVVSPPGGNAGIQSISGSIVVNVAPEGGGLGHNNVQPTVLARKLIRYR